MSEKHTILITGGSGFIGSNLSDRLLTEGNRVICVDNLLTSSLSNIKQAQENKDFKFINHDVIQKLEVDEHIDCIYHLASPASVPDYQKYPEKTALVNSIGTLNMLKLATEHESKFLFASTSEVYGDPAVHPQTENYWGNVNPNGVRACYDESKRFGEAMVMLYVRNHNLDGRIIRIFNTYGPRMRKDDGRVISNLINQALEGNELTIYGDGNQTRSFCYVTDLVIGIIKAMNSEKTIGEVFNLGNPEEYRVIDLAMKVLSITQTKSKTVFKKLPQDDPTRRKPDISKAKNILHWEPTISLNEGLLKTVTYYKTL